MLTVDEIARLVHETNAAYCRIIGDHSQANWNDSPQWQKDSVISGVIFAMHNPDVTPESSHKNWLRDKEADGWTFGPVKNPEKKEHPCFIPYNQLPKEQRLKDTIFLAVVRACLSVP